ncbi:MAG: hypothetical protein HY722_14010 [Planctomycetes bacterium]|nr:hypothetical protein [Planctomycetota bacterium]
MSRDGTRGTWSLLALAALASAACGQKGGHSALPLAPGGPTPAASASTAAGASTAASPGGAFGMPALGRAEVAPPEALQTFNLELARVWARLRPALEGWGRTQGQSMLTGFSHTGGSFEVTVRQVRGVRVDLGPAPGFRAIATDRLALGVPVQGAWTVELEADVRVKVNLGLRMTLDLPLVLTVSDLGLDAEVQIDDSDPARPILRRVAPPVVRRTVNLSSTGAWQGLLMSVLGPAAAGLAQGLVDQALQSLTPSLAGLSGAPGPVPGAGTPPLVDSGLPTPFLEVVRAVDRKLVRDHLPHGTLLRARMDTPAQDSWEDAYGPGGPGNLGQVVSRHGGGDSAIWSGHYLASQAFRHAVTGEAEALDHVRRSVAGIGTLLDVYGGTGLLAREAAPLASPEGQEILLRGAFRQTALGGVPWVGRSGDAGISRDQYSGVFFGLALAHDLVADPGVRADTAARLRQMLDYLVARQWYVDEDRPPFDPAAGAGFPTYWLAVDSQRITWLLIGNRVDPGRYDAELARLSPLAATSWMGAWLSTFNLDSYYKFNLGHIAYYNYFRLETDPVRWRRLARSFLIMRRYVGHHHNPHFDLVEVQAEPASAARLGPSVRESLRRFLRRNHRQIAPPVVDLSGVQWQSFTMRNVNLPGKTSTNGTVLLPSEPLDIPLREYTGYFLWQRSPFKPATAGAGDALDEKPGIDLVLPYWMARHHGVFP